MSLRGANQNRKTPLKWRGGLYKCQVGKNNTHIHAVKLHPFRDWDPDIC